MKVKVLVEFEVEARSHEDAKDTVMRELHYNDIWRREPYAYGIVDMKIVEENIDA